MKAKQTIPRRKRKRVNNRTRKRSNQRCMIIALEHKSTHPDESFKAVADKFGVSKSSLQRFSKRPGNNVVVTSGRPPALTPTQELWLKEWVFKMVDRGFGVTPNMVIQS